MDLINDTTEEEKEKEKESENDKIATPKEEVIEP